jgi:hypothetical protein
MKLMYRGASYEYNQPSLESGEADVLKRHQNLYQRCQTLQEAVYPLIYRGVRYTTDQVADAVASPTLGAPLVVSYRGVKYVRMPNGRVTLKTVEPANATSRVVNVDLREVARIHHENLRRNLERRLMSARERGDQSLVNLLEAESRQLAL